MSGRSPRLVERDVMRVVALIRAAL